MHTRAALLSRTGVYAAAAWGASPASFMNATSITGNQSDANSFVANQALDFITYFLARDRSTLFIVWMKLT